MKTHCTGNVVDVDNSWNKKSKYLPFVFSSVGVKKCFIQPHCLKAAFEERKKEIRIFLLSRLWKTLHDNDHKK